MPPSIISMHDYRFVPLDYQGDPSGLPWVKIEVGSDHPLMKTTANGGFARADDGPITEDHIHRMAAYQVSVASWYETYGQLSGDQKMLDTAKRVRAKCYDAELRPMLVKQELPVT